MNSSLTESFQTKPRNLIRKDFKIHDFDPFINNKGNVTNSFIELHNHET